MTLFLSALGLGLAFCAPPGAVNAESLRRGLGGGFWPAFRLQIGSLIGDMTWAGIALFGVAFLVQNVVARLLLGLLGTVLLARLAWSALRDAWRGVEITNGTPLVGRGDFATGAMLSLTNPWGVVFWLGVGGAIVASGMSDPQPSHFVLFFSGFLLGAFIWCLAFASLVGWGRKLVTVSLFRWINLVCGLGLGYFATRLLWSTAGFLL